MATTVYVCLPAYNEESSLAQLLDEFARLRSENLDALRSLDLRPEDLALRGRHPALGVVTLSKCRPPGQLTI